MVNDLLIKKRSCKESYATIRIVFLRYIILNQTHMHPRKLILLMLIFPVAAFAQMANFNTEKAFFEADTLCLTRAEAELARQLNQYRVSMHLPEIEISASLSVVARLHVYDLSKHYRAGESCNLHSWSKSPYWSSCCYTDDHRKASCMWDKPRELTSYKGDGYEIAFYSNYGYQSPADIAAEALKGWKSSRGHHELIVNRGKWKTAAWKAMGVGVYGGFAVVWFGELPDNSSKPSLCVQ